MEEKIDSPITAQLARRGSLGQRRPLASPVLRREETHHPGQDATTSPHVFSLKLLHPFIELAHLFCVLFCPEMRPD
jgi:hypothetical protein